MIDWMGLHGAHLCEADENHRLHSEVLHGYKAMQLSAHNEGIDLQLVSSYRDFNRQLFIWNNKWNGQATLYDKNGLPLVFDTLTDKDKLYAILTWSALPGASRHHWGTDMDVFDRHSVKAWGQPFQLVTDEYEGQGPCARLAEWLTSNMERFGFYRPFHTYVGGVAAEPWHISYKDAALPFEQERNPQALLAHLRGVNIEGLSVIEACFDDIFPRYVLNRGTP